MRKTSKSERGKADRDTTRREYDFGGGVRGVTAARYSKRSKSRLARECAKLDPKFEQALAEEGFSGEQDEWPEY